jgi:hypothetical protein
VEDRKSKDLLLYGVGDVHPYIQEPSLLFDYVRNTLNKADIAFCQLEINITERGTRLPQARHCAEAKPQAARAIKEAGFNVISFAGNHCMDLGQEAFFDTLEALKKEDLPVIGAGKNIEEARKPAILDKKGTRVAFLAYNTILPMGYWAEENRPGCAPMRAWTHYEQIEHDQPGTPCRIHTFPNREDLDAMVEDIKKAKALADVVVLSMHWGIHFVPAVLADYQREMSHAAIDAGADLILGHHAHILKGIEVYKGKVIFYSLCNFAAELVLPKEVVESPRFKEIQTLNPGWRPWDEYPYYACPPDSRKTIVAKCIISDGTIRKVSFLPTYINPHAQPQILTSTDERFQEVVKYMEEITRKAELDTGYQISGDEVIVA